MNFGDRTLEHFSFLVAYKMAMKSRSFPFGKFRVTMTTLGVGLLSPWVLVYTIRRNALARISHHASLRRRRQNLAQHVSAGKREDKHMSPGRGDRNSAPTVRWDCFSFAPAGACLTNVSFPRADALG